MHKANWDDLRYVLAVADSGSVSGAARALGVNHATVLRRIAAFEERHGGAIFDKTPRGYAIPPDRQQIIEAAREVEAAMHAVERRIEGVQAPLHGVVRITSTDTFCHGILPPVLAGLRQASSDLQLELLCSNSHLDLSRLHADIAVRPTEHLPEDLFGSVPAQLGFAVYAADNAAPGWLGLGGALAKSAPAAWLAGAVEPATLTATADSFITLRELAAGGLGRAVLPCILGDGDPRLLRIEHAMPEIAVDIWVASHTDLANVPRIRAVREHLAEALAARASELRGAGVV